jgi:hypothetical protein
MSPPRCLPTARARCCCQTTGAHSLPPPPRPRDHRHPGFHRPQYHAAPRVRPRPYPLLKREEKANTTSLLPPPSRPPLSLLALLPCRHSSTHRATVNCHRQAPASSPSLTPTPSTSLTIDRAAIHIKESQKRSRCRRISPLQAPPR